jgi:hypothetical protein
VVAVLAACSDSSTSGSSAADIAVERVVVSEPVPYLSVTAATDEMLVGVGSSSELGAAAVYTSRDGAEWERVTLPGATPDVALSPPVRAGRHVVVTGRKHTLPAVYTSCCGSQYPPDAAYVWTSIDGRRWEGGEIFPTTPARDVSVAAAGDTILVAVNVGGRRIAIFSGSGDGRWHEAPVPGYDAHPYATLWLDPDRVTADDDRISVPIFTGDPDDDPRTMQDLVSTDGGRSWRLRPCADERACTPSLEKGMGILVDRDEVSTDGGRTWQRLRVDPPLSAYQRDSFRLGTITGEPGAWLANGSSDPEGDSDFGYLVRSTDGVTWRRQIPGEPCDADFNPSSGFSAPLRVDGAWVSVFTCRHLDAQWSAVYVGDADGRDWRRVHTQRTGSVGEPVVFRGRVWIPVATPDGQGGDELTAMLVVG